MLPWLPVDELQAVVEDDVAAVDALAQRHRAVDARDRRHQLQDVVVLRQVVGVAAGIVAPQRSAAAWSGPARPDPRRPRAGGRRSSSAPSPGRPSCRRRSRRSCPGCRRCRGPSARACGRSGSSRTRCRPPPRRAWRGCWRRSRSGRPRADPGPSTRTPTGALPRRVDRVAGRRRAVVALDAGQRVGRRAHDGVVEDVDLGVDAHLIGHVERRLEAEAQVRAADVLDRSCAADAASGSIGAVRRRPRAVERHREGRQPVAGSPGTSLSATV